MYITSALIDEDSEFITPLTASLEMVKAMPWAKSPSNIFSNDGFPANWVYARTYEEAVALHNVLYGGLEGRRHVIIGGFKPGWYCVTGIGTAAIFRPTADMETVLAEYRAHGSSWRVTRLEDIIKNMTAQFNRLDETAAMLNKSDRSEERMI